MKCNLDEDGECTANDGDPCDGCNERAYERIVEAFYGGSSESPSYRAAMTDAGRGRLLR